MQSRKQFALRDVREISSPAWNVVYSDREMEEVDETFDDQICAC